MRKETTPVKITDKISELCNRVMPEAEPAYVPVIVQEWSLQNECFPNVERMVKERGGQQVNGWAIWQWANVLVEAEAHAVWESPEGELIDITPHRNGEKEILFLRDDGMIYKGNTIASVRSALTSSPLVAELIQLMEERDRIMCATPGRIYSIPEPLWNRIIEIQIQLQEKVSGNEFCPCQSGLKYKKCCGREENQKGGTV